MFHYLWARNGGEKMLKPLKAKINIEVEKTHYGFFSDVLHLANEHEPFKKWLDKNDK